ncbi:MAG: chromate resistance protein ChrB [Propionibacteriaceae bacterium]|nr:chromate resistance protein ChrB [Propionibacteriaceae bacterium]
MSDGSGSARRWLVLLAKVPAEPARYRMALWRELRRSGAVPLGQATWAVPDLPAARPLLDRLADLVGPAGGSLLVLAATGFAESDAARLEHLYAEAREAEWAEFLADCGKYLAELDKEERIGKYTLAELEEEEQSLDRLRRWYRELRSRDLLDISATRDAGVELKQCEERFDVYADHVYAALSQPDASPLEPAEPNGQGGQR